MINTQIFLGVLFIEKTGEVLYLCSTLQRETADIECHQFNALYWTVSSGWNADKGKPGWWVPAGVEVVLHSVWYDQLTLISGVCFPEQGRNKPMEMDCLIALIGEMKLIGAKTGWNDVSGELWQESKYMWRNKMELTLWRLKQNEKTIVSLSIIFFITSWERRQCHSCLDLEPGNLWYLSCHGLDGGSVLGNGGNLAYFICLMLQLLLLMILWAIAKENKARMELHRHFSLHIA